MTLLIARQNVDGSKADTANGVNVANFLLGTGNLHDAVQTLGAAVGSIGAGTTNLTQANAGLAVVDATAGAANVNLPLAAAAAGAVYWLKRGDSTVNTAVINAVSGELIDGAASIALLARSDLVCIRSNGVNAWQILLVQSQAQSYSAFTTVGTAPAYTVTASPAITLRKGATLQLTFHASNNGAASTLNANGSGAIGLKQYDSNGAKVNPQIALGQIADAVCDGAEWVLVDPLPTGRVTGSDFANILINSAFQIDQEQNFATGGSIAAGTSTYVTDGWYAGAVGATAFYNIAVGASGENRMLFTSAVGLTNLRFGQRVVANNCRKWRGQNARWQMKIAAPANTTVNWTVSYPTAKNVFGSLQSPTVTQIATGSFVVGVAENIYVTPIIAIPNAAWTGLQFEISMPTLNGGSITIGDVQVELGTVAGPFVTLPEPIELQRCQAHFRWQCFDTITYAASSQSLAYSAQFVPMWIKPVAGAVGVDPTATLVDVFNVSSTFVTVQTSSSAIAGCVSVSAGVVSFRGYRFSLTARP